jgi:hypothetical protein
MTDGTLVFLQVYVKATQSYESEVNIDNIFFMEDYCDPVPTNAQGMSNT